MASLKKVTKTRRRKRNEQKAENRQRKAALKLRKRVQSEVNLEQVLSAAQ